MKKRKNFLEKMKKKLLSRREELAKQVLNLSQEVSDHEVGDIGDEASILSAEKLQNSIQQTDADELRLIDDALARIKRGDYGICIDCGKEISEKRLENWPFAARCISCKRALESKSTPM